MKIHTWPKRLGVTFLPGSLRPAQLELLVQVLVLSAAPWFAMMAGLQVSVETPQAATASKSGVLTLISGKGAVNTEVCSR